MPQYTTGELAAKCGVSVRTVQFYDRKNLLKPFQLTEGGRRLYCETVSYTHLTLPTNREV